jgi:hypothetical protein
LRIQKAIKQDGMTGCPAALAKLATKQEVKGLVIGLACTVQPLIALPPVPLASLYVPCHVRSDKYWRHVLGAHHKKVE